MQQDTKRRPKRLVKLNGRNNPVLVDLPNCQEDFNDTIKYIALSYCWGQNESLRTVTENLELYRASGFRLTEAPQTIQDAIGVCLLLGIHYVWIDRLCIVQDDDAEWEDEAAKMGDIYQYSFLTVVASSAASAEHGFLRDRNPFQTQDCVLSWPSEKGTYDAVKISPVSWTDEESLSWNPVGKRGWTFQERHLPPRIVHFTERQLLWECPWTKSSEASPHHSFSRIPNIVNIHRLIDHLAWDISDGEKLGSGDHFRWMMVITQYSQRNLSKSKDKLTALSGLAAMTSKLSGIIDDEYLAGVWKRDLIRQILWYSPSDGVLSLRRPGEYRAPSWSWAALDGEIRFHLYDEQYPNAVAPQLLEANVSLAGNNIYGPVTAGSIHLHCLLRFILNGEGGYVWFEGPAFFRDQVRSNVYHVLDEQGHRHGRLSFDTSLVPVDKAFLLRMWESEKDHHIYALVVFPEGDVDDMCFKRIGWAKLTIEAKRWFEEGELTDITLL
jgi:hypothetical protein